MSEYTINAIDESPPREWVGPNGTIYYITVGLEGHEKPVSIGKKSPDALSVGEKVHGIIIPTDFFTDKWKGEAPGGVAPASQRLYPNAQAGKSLPASDNKYLKDASLIPVQLYNGSLNYAKDLGLNLINDKDARGEYLLYIQDVTEEMLKWIDSIRSGEKLDATEETPEKPKGYDKFKATASKLRGEDVTEEFGEEDVPAFEDEE